MDPLRGLPGVEMCGHYHRLECGMDAADIPMADPESDWVVEAAVLFRPRQRSRRDEFWRGSFARPTTARPETISRTVIGE